MKREELTTLVAAAARGYTFHTGEEHTIGGSVRVYPAAWLSPPVLRSRSGRGEGEITWRLTLHLLSLAGGDASTETVWRTLEKDAHEMVAAIASSQAVCSVSGVGCAPARQSLTLHGETSVALTLDVTMWYYA